MQPSDIQSKYSESFEFLQARKRRQSEQLVLLSNMRRGDQNIASTLMLTLFDRVMSGVYDDQMQVKFLPSQGITQKQINSYNTLAQSDYQEMQKAKLDYDWCWDTLFFGRGFLETIQFDRKRKILKPQVINPLAFGYDPYMEEPQEWRYYWKWIARSLHDLKRLEKAGVLMSGASVDTLPTGLEAYLWDYKVRRDEAREGVAPPIEPRDSEVIQLLEYYGYEEDGERYVYWLDKNFSRIIYRKKLELDDGEEIILPDGKSVSRASRWPIVVKEAFRMPHSSLPISIADLLEDKHRAKSVLLNLAYIAAKDQANPLYGYNPDKVRDVAQFLQRQISQHIPMDDETAAWPLNKASTMSPELLNFISLLTQEANEPVGTGQVLQPLPGKKETATEVAIDQQMNDLAQSLQSKVMQFGEQEFWSHWFYRYAKHADELKEKTANIIGVKGVDTSIIDLADFRTDFPPGVMVYSAKEAEYKDLVKRRDYMQLYPALAQTLEPDGMRNFNKHVFFPLFVQDPSLVDIMFPKTLDEIKAEAENEQLQENGLPEVLETDDHTTHLYTHMMITPKTWAAWMHIDWHEQMLAEQKQQQMAIALEEGTDTGVVKVGTEKRNPQSAASPLKTEIISDNLSRK